MFFKRIEEKLDKIIKNQIEENKRRAKWEDNKEKYLFDALDAKGKLETENKKLLKEVINYKDTIKVKDELIEELEKKVESQKEIIKSLTNDTKIYVEYKTENEELKNNLMQTEKENDEHLSKIDELKKENKELKKELKDLKDNGVMHKKKVKGSTMPRKGQRLKETIRPVEVVK